MTQSTTTVLDERKTGPIAIVWNGVFASVQFNCSCLDALDYCHGMCCTRRAGFSVELTGGEVGSYRHEWRGKTPILASKEDGMECYYLAQDGKCSIHDRRPKMCRQWHCSPQGQTDDKEIERRDAGWMLMPVRKEEAEFVQSIRRDDGS